MAGMRIRVNPQRCKRCGMCVEICPEGLFQQTAPGRPPRVTRTRQCTACGHCVSVCKSRAVEHADFPPEDWLEVE